MVRRTPNNKKLAEQFAEQITQEYFTTPLERVGRTGSGVIGILLPFIWFKDFNEIVSSRRTFIIAIVISAGLMYNALPLIAFIYLCIIKYINPTKPPPRIIEYPTKPPPRTPAEIDELRKQFQKKNQLSKYEKSYINYRKKHPNNPKLAINRNRVVDIRLITDLAEGVRLDQRLKKELEAADSLVKDQSLQLFYLACGSIPIIIIVGIIALPWQCSGAISLFIFVSLITGYSYFKKKGKEKEIQTLDL